MKLISLLHVDDDEKFTKLTNGRLLREFVNLRPDFALSNEEMLSKWSSSPWERAGVNLILGDNGWLDLIGASNK